MQTLRVAITSMDAGYSGYPIYIGEGLLDRSELLTPLLTRPQVAIVTNETVAPLYLERISTGLQKAGIQITSAILPDGEEHKTWPTLNRIFDAMLSARCDRGTTVVALGGGVVGDLAGFAAASFMRGVSFVQVPTTLLAQVDSSVGGKTGLNHPLGKNMIGAFHQPVGVLADLSTLDSLPERELRAGIAEVIKHGIIRDAVFFEWIERNIERLLGRDREALTHAVQRSIEIKAELVALDERETGPRALLNFGHTFGHAIEAGLGFGTWLHGEAVGAGMVMAADLSQRLGYLSKVEAGRINDLIRRAGLPTAGPAFPPDRYIELMSLDKKARSGKLRFILAGPIGSALIADDTAPRLLMDTLRATVT